MTSPTLATHIRARNALFMLSLLVCGCSTVVYGSLVFTKHNQKQEEIPAVDGLPWTNVTPVEMLPLIYITQDVSTFDFCDVERYDPHQQAYYSFVFLVCV